MIRPGLCSVTFRELSVPQVVALAAAAGLACIEWAGDVHVPPGDLAAARRAREATEEAGLAVASYGTYLDMEGADGALKDATQQVLASARELGAPRIRVWAGRTGSAEAGAQQRTAVVERLQHVCDAAAAEDIEVGLEFHGKTLTDEIGSTLRLLDEVGRANLRSYWQPHQGMDRAAAVDTLHQVLPLASTIHVFSWWPMAKRLPLAERSTLWQEVFTVLAAEGSDRDALLEFVPGDDPAVLAREAQTLRDLIAAGEQDAHDPMSAEAAR